MAVPLRVQPNWNNEQREARLHPSIIAQLKLAANDHVRIAQDTAEAAPAVPSILCGFVSDASVAADVLVLPLDTCQLTQWKQATNVSVSRLESIVLPKRAASSSAAAASSPVPPRASRVRMRAWKPTAAVEWNQQPQTADVAVPAAAAAAPFLSPVLAEMLHQQLLQSAGIALHAEPFSSDFRVLHWNGLACLTAVASIYVDDAESSERVVQCALIDGDTEVDCEVMPTTPTFFTQPAVPASAASVSSAAAPRSIFPHLRPVAPAAASSTAVSACFPREWRTLHTFVHHAMQAHGAAAAHGASSSSSLRSPFGLSWGVPRALLLSGGAGTGKSALLTDLESGANPTRLHVKRIPGSTLLAEAMADEQGNVLQRYHTELINELVQINAASSSSSPPTAGLLILEDLDAVLCGDSYQRLATQLLALLERIAAPTRSGSSADASPPPLSLLVVSVKSFDAVPAHFLSSGRFDAQLRMGLLSREQRALIARHHLTEGLQHSQIPFDLKGMPTQRAVAASASAAAAPVSQLDALCTSLGALTPGFIAADLAKLVQYAFLQAARRWDGQGSHSMPAQSAPLSVASPFGLHWSDFASALSHTHPSARGTASKSHMRFQAEDGGAEGDASSSWPTVGGYPLLKKRLNMTLHHWLNPSSVSALGLRPISGVLFHGASGVGKSLWASALSKHAGFNFLELSVASLFSQWLGESEATIRNAFRQAAELAPCVLLLDQIESMAGKRDEAGGSGGGGDGGGASGVDARVLSTLLNELDGVGGRRTGVHVVACCRDLRALDSALLRPGRFDEVIEVCMPTAQDRAEILRIMSKGAGGRTRATALADDVNLEAIAEHAEGMTGADLRELLSSAGMVTLRRDVHATAIEQSALLAALRHMTHGEDLAIS